MGPELEQFTSSIGEYFYSFPIHSTTAGYASKEIETINYNVTDNE